MKRTVAMLVLCAVSGLQAQTPAPAPTSQNPSPMSDNARAHGRVAQTETTGQRWKLSVGTLLLPRTARLRPVMPLYIHFHGAPWLAEWSANQRDRKAAIITVQLGAGSGVYARAFSDPQTFAHLLD